MNDDDNEEKELIELKITNYTNNTINNTINNTDSNNTNNRNIILEIINSSINDMLMMKKEVVLKKIASNSLR